MSKSFDLRTILENSIIYNTFQQIVGGVRARRLFVERDIQIQAHQNILDIGCGPGYIVDFLPEVNYTGIDIDEKYIKTAKEKYPEKSFYCTAVEDFVLEAENSFDVVIAAGVLHHLDDKQSAVLFELAKRALKPGGRLVTLDGCFKDKQNLIAKALLKLDRGQFVRHEAEYRNLAAVHFKKVNTKIEHKYFHFPYTTLIMDCSE